jgi:hypothetical protein
LDDGLSASAENTTFREISARISLIWVLSPDAESAYNGEKHGHGRQHSLPWLHAEANANPGLFRPLSRLILEVVPRDPRVFSPRRQGQNDLVCRLPPQT